ncbi:MAG: GTP pyrophosphokinase [Lachnospiraceae bacterium]|nr:GTP pyrophosphokinase [Lachnospiraceae bacterium]MBQ3973467.1 GTP pyrophosphokinase [Lachnospiraceae bacterium]MBQ4303226.1 GTP pyrophosphokinase [Lachnospiraceae bacterium]MBQ5360647.1 GTP pyrophosphokinase [Lachnospiraceae bacterium]
MIYTKLTANAMKLCYEAHMGQTDKSGLPYVFHPFHVAEQMQDEYTAAAALLHDTLEDTWVTPDYLRKEGYPEEVVQALILLTHDPAEPYMDYVRRIKKNPIARAVKMADLAHNADLSRLEGLDAPAMEKAVRRAEKYRKAMEILEN